MNTIKSVFGILTIIFGLGLAVKGPAQSSPTNIIYDVSGDFAIASNPNGPAQRSVPAGVQKPHSYQ